MEGMQKKTITVKELAHVMGLSEIYCYRLVHSEGFYPAFKIGKRILINVDRLDDWMREQGEKGINEQ